jgi:hypothetical protein
MFLSLELSIVLVCTVKLYLINIEYMNFIFSIKSVYFIENRNDIRTLAWTFWMFYMQLARIETSHVSITSLTC